MVDSVKKVKQVCKCENCGNEAEMVVTCTLPEADTERELKKPETDLHQHANHQRIKGTATCTHCGNEADMWVDLD
jgi:hypothetical protein